MQIHHYPQNEIPVVHEGHVGQDLTFSETVRMEPLITSWLACRVSDFSNWRATWCSSIPSVLVLLQYSRSPRHADNQGASVLPLRFGEIKILYFSLSLKLKCSKCDQTER